MKAGRLRHRVTIEKNTPTTTGRGERRPAWSTLADVWADIRPLRGREYYQAQQTNAELTTEIEIRYRDDVTSKMRVVWGDRVFDVVAPPVNVDMLNRALILLCAERS